MGRLRGRPRRKGLLRNRERIEELTERAADTTVPGPREANYAWQEALAASLEEPTPCFLCAETSWRRCHRQLIAHLLVARGHEVLHLLPDGVERHRLSDDAEVREGRLYLCGELVA